MCRLPLSRKDLLTDGVDNRRNSLADYRRKAWRRKQLQLGWVVRHSSRGNCEDATEAHTYYRAYLLGAAAPSPFYGKLADAFGRKPLLYSVVILFLVFSALCGAAQNMTWLIVCRAIQGVGGGGIFQLVQITISDIVSLEE